jgi:hypothetical protein
MYTHEIFTFQDPTEMEKAEQKKSEATATERAQAPMLLVSSRTHTELAKKKQKSTLKYIKKHFTISINKSNIF